MPKSLSAQGPTPKPSPHLTKVPDTGYLIPPHVMGRNLDDPTEDVIGTGRKVQRPRLGVRVPYRNLTSQIVTQDEIAQEILQRSLRKNNAPTNAEVKDVFFAMKLTQRLANRLTTSPGKAEEEQVDDPMATMPEPPPQQENKQQAASTSTSSKFDPPPKMDPALERELALKQLNELPSLKKQRRRRCDPGPADHVLIRTNVKAEQKPKRKVRKQRGEVDRGIQAGPGALANLKVAVKRKSPLILITPTTKKAKSEVKKMQGLVNGTTQTSPAKTEGEPLQVAAHEVVTTESGTDADSPKKRKQHRELDMLLGDEGAVNMIYEAEHGQKQQVQARQPRKNRQDMMFKARLVKNAVLRLSSGPLPSRPRGRRKSTPPTSPPSVTPSEPRSPPQSFNFPPKLAEQSRIIRRHSSDSEFSSRSNSPEPKVKEPLTIIPGPRKKKGVPIFVKKIERTYKGKKKLTVSAVAAGEKPAPKTPKILVKRPIILPVELQKTPPTSPDKKVSPPSNKNKISMAVKNKLTDEMSRNFQQVVNPEATPTEPVATPPQPTPNRRRKQELESRPYDDAKFILEDDPTLSYGVSWVPVNENWSLEAQLAAVVGEPLDEQPEVMVSAASTSTVELDVSLEQPDLFAPSTSSGGMMKASPTSQSPNSKQRQSVRQSAGNYCYREINLRRYANLVQIILTPVSTKMKNALNVQVLRELKEALNQLKRDEGCRVVLLSSTGSSFCQGIDVHALIHSNLEKRKKSAQDLAQALKEFLKALAHFTKPLAAAVHGPAVGLGVTMLPFFDMVFASDKATFYAPYAQLGQVPEGAVALTMPSLLGSNTASELLYCCRKLTATEAQRAGLVTRILWPDRFQEELIPTLCTIAAQSAQAMEGSKQLLRETLRSNLDAALESESALLVQHWCSSECQNAYRALLEAEGVGLQKQRTEPVAQ